MGETLPAFTQGLPLKLGGMELRGYQVRMAARVLERGNSLVIMPTALGKTFVAALVIAKFVKQMREGQRERKKILFLTPTKPLAGQQAKRLLEWIEWEGKTETVGEGKKAQEVGDVLVLSGETAPHLREKLWASSAVQVVCATPQTVEFDLLAGRMRLEEFCLVVFDEAHRAVKEHSYAFLAQEAARRKLFLLGLTASPSSRRETVDEICRNLNIANVELKDERDEEVRPYAKPITLKWIFVELPKDMAETRGLIEEMLKEDLQELREFGVLESTDFKRHKRGLLDARRKALEMARTDSGGYRALSVQARAMNESHALDLLETEGVHALTEFMKEMAHRPQKSKAVQGLLQDFRWKLLGLKLEELGKRGVEHPKMGRLKALVSDAVGGGRSVIVFAHYRDTVEKIVEELGGFAGVKPVAFVGKSKNGMTQKKQAQVLQEFKDGKFNVLVATSVAEEGIDVPSVDLVVFYEAVPSEIRAIQRRGRTGRTREGSAVVLITKGSKDEAFFWISKSREKKMKQMLGELKQDLSKKKPGTGEEGGELSTDDQDELIAKSQTSMLDF